MSGLRLAALYSLFPHKLGFCGPHKKAATQALLNYLYPHTKGSGVGVSGKKISEKKIRKILKDFKRAYSYYKLIAKSNNIGDPFNERVIKAYWIGNELLEKVKINDFRQMIAKEFSKPKEAQEISDNSKPHHNFHVLILGSVLGMVIPKGKFFDLCRINWGRVEKFKINPKAEPLARYRARNEIFKILIKYQPLIKKNKKFKLGKLIKKEIIWNKNLQPKIKIGDWVSLHWDHLIEKLKKEDLESLKKYTKITLKGLS